MRAASPDASRRSRPIFASRPPAVRGIPNLRDSRAFAAERPRSREREKPPLFIPLWYTPEGETYKGEGQSTIQSPLSPRSTTTIPGDSPPAGREEETGGRGRGSSSSKGIGSTVLRGGGGTTWGSMIVPMREGDKSEKASTLGGGDLSVGRERGSQGEGETVAPSRYSPASAS